MIRGSHVPSAPLAGLVLTSLAALTALGCSQGAQDSGLASQTQAQSQTLSASTSSSAASTTASTTAGDGGPREHRHHGPPPEAFDACTGKAVGNACSVTFHDKSLAGKCVPRRPPPDGAGAPDGGTGDGRIFCLPDNMPPHGPDGADGGPRGPHKPPAEAFTACDGKSADASCSVTFKGHSMDGTCRTPPPGSGETRLACAPTHRGGPPPGQDD